MNGEPEIVLSAQTRADGIVRIWRHHRDLWWFLARRDLVVRYRQMVIGMAWVLLRPLATMAVFTIILGHFAKVPSEGFPYHLLVLSGLVPWLFFANVVAESALCIVGNEPLITKVYFPRLVLPLALIPVNLIDLAVAFIVLIGLMFFSGLMPAWTIIFIPLATLPLLCAALGVGLLVASMMARFRDLKNVIPFIIQLGMFLSPVIYAANLVPEHLRWVLGCNPLTATIESWRWCLFGNAYPIPWMEVGIASVVSVLVLIIGRWWFAREEQRFADVL